MKKIIVDTNFLLIPSVFKVDIFTEIQRICPFRYEIHVLNGVIDELNKIVEKQRGRDREAASLALQLIKRKHLKIVIGNQGKTVDEIIVGMADKDTIVATQDGALKRRLQEKNIPLIVLRQKKYLSLVGV